ncbi:MAG: hypothetical protein IJ264_05420 [Clostridia bacterium]|nr:hypothetical protein [Clostridia bacterium]
MLQYFLERPYLILIMLAMVVLTLFVCVKAGQASSKRSKVNEKLIKKLKEENEIRNEFAILTSSLAQSAQPERLFKGVALNLQKRVSDAQDMVAEFEKLTQEQREIYALSFITEDGGEKLSGFFRTNGQPLTGEALNAVKRLFGGRAAEIFELEYKAFDSDNEDVSVIPEEIEALDKEFAELINENIIGNKAGSFIKENIEKFI